MSNTVSIPFQPMPQQMLFMAVRQAERPDEAYLMQRVSQWVQEQMHASLACVLQEYITCGGGTLHVLDASEAHIRQFLEGARALDGHADPLRLEGVRWCVIISAQGVMVPPMMHVWFSRAAAHVLSAHFGEPVSDAVNLLTDPRYTDPQVIAGTRGDVHLSQHLRLLASTSAAGMVRLSSLGMQDFGLPDLELHGCPAGLTGAGQVVLAATAQHLLSAAMAKTPELDDAAVREVQALDLPEEFCLTRTVLDAAMGTPAQGNIASTPLRLKFVQGDASKFAAVQIIAPEALEDAGEDWFRVVVEQLAPAAPPAAQAAL